MMTDEQIKEFIEKLECRIRDLNRGYTQDFYSCVQEQEMEIEMIIDDLKEFLPENER